MTTAINFDFATAFVFVVLGYNPEFRFVYEKGQAEDFVICYDTTGKDITGFGKAHGYWVNIDDIVENDNWFDKDDVKDIPDQEEICVREWFDAEDFEDLDLEENWFFSSDIENIPDELSPLDKLKQEINELTLLIRKAELTLHSNLMRQVA